MRGTLLRFLTHLEYITNEKPSARLLVITPLEFLFIERFIDRSASNVTRHSLFFVTSCIFASINLATLDGSPGLFDRGSIREALEPHAAAANVTRTRRMDFTWRRDGRLAAHKSYGSFS